MLLTENRSELSKNRLLSVLKQADTKMSNLRSFSSYSISSVFRTKSWVRLGRTIPKNSKFWRQKSSPLLTTISQIYVSRKEIEKPLLQVKKYAPKRIPLIFLISFRKNSAKSSQESSFYLKIILKSRKPVKIHPKRVSFLTIINRIS